MFLIYINSYLSTNQKNKIVELLENRDDIVISGAKKIICSIGFSNYFLSTKEIEPELVNKILIIDNNSIKRNLPNKLLVSIFSIKPIPVKWLNEDGFICTKKSKSKPTTLFIFPGTILPISMGSHQRAFNFIYNLSESGVKFDILIPDNPNINKSALASSLEMLAENVYFYKNRIKKFSRIKIITRGIEKFFRKLLGKTDVLPDLFSERANRKATESLKRWVNNLYIYNNYEDIIVSYAWMLNGLQYIYHLKDNFNLICDTHDVQFYRNENILNRRERLFFNKQREKNLEISLLNNCDSVISISESDRRILEKNIKSKIIELYPGFDYIKMPVKQRPVGRPIHFGFIGGGMNANVAALEYIINNWWPVIKKHSPDSLLYVAGSICNNKLIKSDSFFDENIVLLGFVKNLSDFYSKFEISLNPVLISGGLNFKSVEAVCAGKYLFTNKLGKECLTEKFPCIVIDSKEELISEMNRIEFNLNNDKKIRIANQRLAISIFGDDNQQQAIKKLLI